MCLSCHTSVVTVSLDNVSYLLRLLKCHPKIHIGFESGGEEMGWGGVRYIMTV